MQHHDRQLGRRRRTLEQKRHLLLYPSKELAYCGKVSGREEDKIAETGLTPVFDREAPYFAEADLVLICKKLYRQTMTPECFADSALVSAFYSDGDYHETFVGEIVSVLKKS